MSTDILTFMQEAVRLFIKNVEEGNGSAFGAIKRKY